MLNELDILKMALTTEEIATVLAKKSGNITQTAKALKVTRQAIHLRVKDDETLQQIVTDAREAMVDVAESEALKQIKLGNTAMIIYTLKTQGKERGWQESIETKHSGEVTVINKGYGVAATPDDWDEAEG